MTTGGGCGGSAALARRSYLRLAGDSQTHEPSRSLRRIRQPPMRLQLMVAQTQRAEILDRRRAPVVPRLGVIDLAAGGPAAAPREATRLIAGHEVGTQPIGHLVGATTQVEQVPSQWVGDEATHGHGDRGIGKQVAQRVSPDRTCPSDLDARRGLGVARLGAVVGAGGQAEQRRQVDDDVESRLQPWRRTISRTGARQRREPVARTPRPDAPPSWLHKRSQGPDHGRACR